jgi:Flp pilus assembly protein TadD
VALVAACLLPVPRAPAAVPTDSQAQRLSEEAPAAKARGDFQLVEAAQEFKKELEISPDDSLALWKLGEIALCTDPHEAAGYLQRSVALNPDLPQAVLAYGRALARLGETEKAIEQFRRVVELAPEEDSVHDHLARAYRLLGHDEEARIGMAKFDELAKKKSQRTQEQARQLIQLTREDRKTEKGPEPGFDPSRDPTHH